jgi:hypothetical protein
MAAVTSTLVALGGIGVSAAQAIKSQSQMKEATQASNLAKQQLKQIKETNPFKALQVPTLGIDMARQQQSQRETQMIGALQGTGAEGVLGGIGQLAAAGNEQDMALAAQADKAQYDRDMAQAEAQLGIGARQAERDFTVGLGEVQQQNAIRAQAQKDRNAAITGALGSAADMATSLDDIIGLYRNKNIDAADAQRKAGMGIGVLKMEPQKGKVPAFATPGASLYNMMGIPGLNG